MTREIYTTNRYQLKNKSNNVTNVSRVKYQQKKQICDQCESHNMMPSLVTECPHCQKIIRKLKRNDGALIQNKLKPFIHNYAELFRSECSEIILQAVIGKDLPKVLESRKNQLSDDAYAQKLQNSNIKQKIEHMKESFWSFVEPDACCARKREKKLALKKKIIERMQETQRNRSDHKKYNVKSGSRKDKIRAKSKSKYTFRKTSTSGSRRHRYRSNSKKERGESRNRFQQVDVQSPNTQTSTTDTTSNKVSPSSSEGNSSEVPPRPSSVGRKHVTKKEPLKANDHTNNQTKEKDQFYISDKPKVVMLSSSTDSETYPTERKTRSESNNEQVIKYEKEKMKHCERKIEKYRDLDKYKHKNKSKKHKESNEKNEVVTIFNRSTDKRKKKCSNSKMRHEMFNKVLSSNSPQFDIASCRPDLRTYNKKTVYPEPNKENFKIFNNTENHNKYERPTIKEHNLDNKFQDREGFQYNNLPKNSRPFESSNALLYNSGWHTNIPTYQNLYTAPNESNNYVFGIRNFSPEQRRYHRCSEAYENSHRMAEPGYNCQGRPPLMKRFNEPLSILDKPLRFQNNTQNSYSYPMNQSNNCPVSNFNGQKSRFDNVIDSFNYNARNLEKRYIGKMSTDPAKAGVNTGENESMPFMFRNSQRVVYDKNTGLKSSKNERIKPSMFRNLPRVDDYADVQSAGSSFKIKSYKFKNFIKPYNIQSRRLKQIKDYSKSNVGRERKTMADSTTAHRNISDILKKYLGDDYKRENQPKDVYANYTNTYDFQNEFDKRFSKKKMTNYNHDKMNSSKYETNKPIEFKMSTVTGHCKITNNLRDTEKKDEKPTFLETKNVRNSTFAAEKKTKQSSAFVNVRGHNAKSKSKKRTYFMTKSQRLMNIDKNKKEMKISPDSKILNFSKTRKSRENSNNAETKASPLAPQKIRKSKTKPATQSRPRKEAILEKAIHKNGMSTKKWRKFNATKVEQVPKPLEPLVSKIIHPAELLKIKIFDEPCPKLRKWNLCKKIKCKK